MKKYLTHKVLKSGNRVRITLVDSKDEKSYVDVSPKNLEKYLIKFKYGVDFQNGFNLNSLADKYLNSRWQLVLNRRKGSAEGIKTTTYDTEAGWIKHVRKIWGETNLNDISPLFILDVMIPFLKDFDNYKDITSAEKIYNVFQRIMNFGMEREIINYIKLPKFIKGRKTQQRAVRPTPTVEEVQKILTVVSPYYKVLLLTLATTGLRIGECLALQWLDIDFDKKTLTIKRSISGNELDVPKTENGFRTIPLADKLLKVLRNFKIDIYKYVDLAKPTNFIFPDNKGSFKNKDTARQQSIYDVNKKFKLNYDFQSFRRFFRTNMEEIYDELKINPLILDYRFGHASRTVAERHYIAKHLINSENESVNVLANKII